MRLKEFLYEDYNQQLSGDLDNILVGAKAAGIEDINPEAVVRELQRMGYSVDVDSLIALLQNNPIVQNASPSGISLTAAETSTTDTDQDSANQVDQMAQQAAQKGLK